MFHYFNAITNTKGDALIGYYVKLRDSAGDEVDIFADESSTPIISVSEVANAAKVDGDGNVDFYVDDGEYTLDIYATDATTLVKSISNVPMRDPLGDGDKGDVLVADSGSTWTVQSAAGDFAVAGILQPAAGVLETGTVITRLQNTGAAAPSGAAGAGLELIGNTSGNALIQAYNRTSSAFIPLQIAGSVLSANFTTSMAFAINSVTKFSIDSSGNAAFAGDVTVSDEAYGVGWNGSLEVPTKNAIYDKIETLGGGSGVSDGDKGDITVSASGATWTIDNDAVTYAKMQNVSATSRILGRITTGAGDVEELTAANVKTILALAQADISGLTSASTPEFFSLKIGSAAADATIARPSAGDLTIGGNIIYRAGGTDVPIADGGTGASTAAGAATNLGLGTGDSPQFTAINLGHASDTTISRTGAGDIAIEGNAVYRAGGTDVPLADGGTGASLSDPNADRIMFWDDSAGAVTWLTVGTNLTITDTTLDASGGGGSAVDDTLCTFTPMQNEPPASAYATLDMRNSHPVLDFDQNTDESAIFSGILPRRYAGGGVVVRLMWAATSATTGDVRWDVAFERIADADTQTDDLDTDSFASAQSATATVAATDAGRMQYTDITFTNGAQMDSIAVGEMFRVKVTRDADNAADTLAGDAELVMVEIKEA